jgi:ornithine cyclodeaminase/alanine dehydrogenase-like protein (mu-crystallin family)
MDTLIVTTDDIRIIARQVGLDVLMDEMIRRLTLAFKTYDEEQSVVQVRSGFTYDRPETGLLEWMPIMEAGSHITIKLVGYHPCNPCLHNLPTILSTISLYETATGHLAGLADATFLTALRTGAASAVASRVLAAPDSGVLGLVGCGAQAVTQLHALSRVFSLEEVLLYDQDAAVAHTFSERTAFIQPQPNMRVTPLKELVATADIVCTATSVGVGHGPVFQDTAVAPWLHINAVGSDFPGKTEVPRSLLKRSFVCPDFLPQAVKEGECQQLTAAEIGPDLIEVVQHENRYQHVQQQISVFDSTGFALEDQVAMEMLLDFAQQLGVGRRVQLESTSGDPRNPYHFIDENGTG